MTDKLDRIEKKFNQIKEKRAIAKSDMDKAIKKVKDEFDIETKAEIEKELKIIEKEVQKLAKDKGKLESDIEEKLSEYDEL